MARSATVCAALLACAVGAHAGRISDFLMSVAGPMSAPTPEVAAALPPELAAFVLSHASAPAQAVVPSPPPVLPSPPPPASVQLYNMEHPQDQEQAILASDLAAAEAAAGPPLADPFDDAPPGQITSSAEEGADIMPAFIAMMSGGTEVNGTDVTEFDAMVVQAAGSLSSEEMNTTIVPDEFNQRWMSTDLEFKLPAEDPDKPRQIAQDEVLLTEFQQKRLEAFQAQTEQFQQVLAKAAENQTATYSSELSHGQKETISNDVQAMNTAIAQANSHASGMLQQNLQQYEQEAAAPPPPYNHDCPKGGCQKGPPQAGGQPAAGGHDTAPAGSNGGDNGAAHAQSAFVVRQQI